jgi:hypothetical protein
MLTSISAPKLLTAASFHVDECAILPSFAAPLLTTVSLLSTGGGVRVSQNPLLTNFSFPALVTADSVKFFDNSILTQALFPALTTVGYDDVWVKDNPSLVVQNFPVLMTIGGSYEVSNNLLLTTLTQPMLAMVSDFVLIDTNPQLSSVNISALLSSPNGVTINNNASLTTITIGVALNVTIGGLYDFSDNALTQASVDDILAKLDSGGLSGRLLTLFGGTNATPSAAGLVSKANLIGKGWTVTTN